MPVIDHVQKTTISVGTGDASKDWTFGTVLDDITRCVISFTIKGNDSDEGRINKGAFRCVLNGTTTATFLRDTTGKAFTIEAQVVQYASGEATVQRGTGTGTTDPIDQTISAVDTSLAIPLYTYYSDILSGMIQETTPQTSFTSTTNLRFDFDATPGTSDFRYSYQVLEWTSADVSVESSTHLLAATDDSDVVTLTTDLGNVNKGLLTFAFRFSGGSEPYIRAGVRGRITATNAITFDRQDGGSGSNINITYWVVKFLDSTVVHAVNINLGAGVTSNTGSISASDTANCALWQDWWVHHWRYIGTEGTAHDWDVMATVVVTSTTVVTASRVGDDGAVDYWAQAVEYPTGGAPPAANPKGWFGLPLRGPMRRAAA